MLLGLAECWHPLRLWHPGLADPREGRVSVAMLWFDCMRAARAMSSRRQHGWREGLVAHPGDTGEGLCTLGRLCEKCRDRGVVRGFRQLTTGAPQRQGSARQDEVRSTRPAGEALKDMGQRGGDRASGSQGKDGRAARGREATGAEDARGGQVWSKQRQGKACGLQTGAQKPL